MSLFDKDELLALVQDTDKYADLDEVEAQKLSRKEVLSWMADFSSALKEQLQDSEALDPETRDERVAECLADYNKFRHTYFSHYYTAPEESELQVHLKSIIHKIRDKKGTDLPGERFATAAPRGFGKSTDISLTFPIYCIVYEIKHFGIIISDAIELSETLIEAIKIELEENEALKGDFPDATGVGRMWKVGDIISKNNRRLKAYGTKKKARGIKHGRHRVDFAAGDDLENDDNVRSRVQRDKLEEWLDSAIENLGDVTDDKMDFIYIGTLLHRDSVLSRKLKLAFWNPVIFKALERYPDRMDLWDEYTTLYRSEGVDTAHEFYINRKKAMDKGAQLLWDAVTLESLMKKRAKSIQTIKK